MKVLICANQSGPIFYVMEALKKLFHDPEDIVQVDDRDAFQKLKSDEIHLLVLCVSGPLSGRVRDLIRSVRDELPKRRIVCVGTDISMHEAKEAILVGAHAYVSVSWEAMAWRDMLFQTLALWRDVVDPSY